MVVQADFDAQKAIDTDGDSQAHDVFASVGIALSAWEHVEETLAALYTFMCGPTKSTHAAFRSYGTLTGSLARRKMISAAAEVFFFNFPEESLSFRLNQLMNIYSAAGARRNEIAHGVVMGPSLFKVENKIAIPLPVKWYLFPALHATKARSLQLEGEYRFNSQTIKKYATLFDDFGSDIQAFRTQLIALYESFPETHRAQY